MGNEPNGLNINEGVGSLHPQILQKAVLEHGADLGVAFDGDGDRVLMVDGRGQLVDGDQLLFVLANERQAQQRLGGGVVGTLMTNHGLDVAFRERGIEFVRANVGDRYVHQQMVQRGWLLGGETSGHILCLDKTSTGDAIISALEVLEILSSQGRTLEDACTGFEKFPQQMINVPVSGKVQLDAAPAVVAAVTEIEAELGDEGRVILRPSGTEPVVRVTVEGRQAAQVQRLAEQLAGVVEQAFT